MLATTNARIDTFLAKYDAIVQKEARAARRILRKTMPSAVELVYDNYNALVFAFGASEKASEIVLSIALYPRWVTLFFLRGTDLDDPKGVLEGAGKTIRGIRLVGGAKDLSRPDVKALVHQAIARAMMPLPVGVRGKTVIKSVSLKKRPRTPSKRS